MTQSDRFDQALRLIDDANSEDPNSEVVDGVRQPKELVYGMRMSAWLEKLDPEASEELKLAARAQHIRRWEIPRSGYPMDRAGYHKWRTTLYRFHADKAAQILHKVGYDGRSVSKVADLLQKKDLKSDPETQTLEDAAALVFLEYHLADFASRDDIDETKAIEIIRKTWNKMSEHGQKAALALEKPPETVEIIRRALG